MTKRSLTSGSDDERANCRYFASPFRYSRALVQLTRISRALGRYRRCEELDVVLNELTDLPDDAARISELADLNARIHTEVTQNLIEAARRSGSPKILAQSVAWQLPDGPDAQAVAELERSVLAEGGQRYPRHTSNSDGIRAISAGEFLPTPLWRCSAPDFGRGLYTLVLVAPASPEAAESSAVR